MRTPKSTGRLRGACFALAMIAALGLGTAVPAQDDPDPDDETSMEEGDAEADDGASDDASPEETPDEAAGADEEDADDEDADGDVVDEEDPDGVVADEDDEGEADAESDLTDDDDPESQGVATADGAEDVEEGVDDLDFEDGSTPADEFLATDWAPDVLTDPVDDALPVDRELDPTGLGWVAADDERVDERVDQRVDEHRPQARRTNGDYAGPTRILEMRPRRASDTVVRPREVDQPDRPYSFGGQPIAPGSAPWQAQIYRSLAKETPGVPRWKAQHNCGGTLIAPGWILTAAHCIDDIVGDPQAGWRVRLGGRDLAREDGVTYAVDRWVRHSGYRNVPHPDPPAAPLSPPNMYGNDIGLVHFTSDAQTRLRSDAAPVVPVTLYRSAVKGGDEVTAIGWGMTGTAAKSFSAVPLKIDLRVMDTPLCQARPGYGPARVSASVICAAREGQKTCRGDSGGPVILTNGTTPKLVGLVSWGKRDCSGDGRPSVFTRIESHLAWIEQALRLPETRASWP